MSPIAHLETALAEAQRGEREARRALVAALSESAVATWWAGHAGARQLVDALGVRWVVRAARPTGVQLEELDLVRPVAHVRLRGDFHPLHPRRRLTAHHASVMEETRRTCAARPSALPPADERPAVDWARRAANDRD